MPSALFSLVWNSWIYQLIEFRETRNDLRDLPSVWSRFPKTPGWSVIPHLQLLRFWRFGVGSSAWRHLIFRYALRRLRLCTGCLTYGGFLITKFWKTMKNFAEKHCANMYLAYYDCRYRNTCQYVAIREVEFCASIPGSWNETGTTRMTCLG